MPVTWLPPVHERWLFDFLFGAHSGVSILFGTDSDRARADTLLEAHRFAVHEAVDYLETEGCYGWLSEIASDLGAHLRTSITEHIESSEGHPYIHTHVLVSSHVPLATDRPERGIPAGYLVPIVEDVLLGAWMAACPRYLGTLEGELVRSYGFAFEDTDALPGRMLLGIPEGLVARFTPTTCRSEVRQKVAAWRGDQ